MHCLCYHPYCSAIMNTATNFFHIKCTMAYIDFKALLANNSLTSISCKIIQHKLHTTQNTGVQIIAKCGFKMDTKKTCVQKEIGLRLKQC